MHDSGQTSLCNKLALEHVVPATSAALGIAFKLDALLSLARAFSWLEEIAGKDRSLFYHWQRGQTGQTPRLCLCTRR